MALSSAPVQRPMLWKQYVDDTWCIDKKGTAEVLLGHLNKIQPSIQFTLELEEALPRHKLGVKDRWNLRHHHLLETHPYRKLVSECPVPLSHLCHERTCHCLYDKARKIITSPDSLQIKDKHLENISKVEGLPFIYGSFILPSKSSVESQGEQTVERPPHW